MAFLDELRDRAMDLGRAGVAKSKQLAEITRLSLNNASEEDAIKKAYVEIGKLYYAERGMAPEAAYVSLCEKITAAKINIEENKARIAELKAESGVSDADVPPVSKVYQAGRPPKRRAPCFSCNQTVTGQRSTSNVVYSYLLHLK